MRGLVKAGLLLAPALGGAFATSRGKIEGGVDVDDVTAMTILALTEVTDST